MEPVAIRGFFGPNRWLSNFWPVPITDDTGYVWHCSEQAYQAMKFPAGSEVRRKIMECKTAAEAKKLGRSSGAREDWDDIKVDLMLKIQRKKFAPGTELAKKLLATGEAEIVEANTWGDTFWGECNGVGENNLGRLIMQVRRELRYLEPCDPVEACATHGRCWTHSEWENK